MRNVNPDNESTAEGREPGGEEGVEAGAGAFRWIANDPCLDFVNTEVIRHGERTDLIGDAEDLVSWLTRAGLLVPGRAESLRARWRERPEAGAEALRRARAFRTVLRSLAEEAADTGTVSEAVVRAVNERLKLRVGYRQITRGKGEGFVARFEDAHGGAETAGDESASAAEQDATYVLGLLAEAAADLLCRADLSLVRRCENPRCILFFLDTTKNHARRWCSMSGCGNRAKAAAHYRKKRGPIST
jgi:predicted RNA-binding Zn ribbon-like protein